MLEKYAVERQRSVGPPEWVVDVFLALRVPHDTLLPVLEALFYGDEAPFRGRNRGVIASHIVYLCEQWYRDSIGGGGGGGISSHRPFGGRAEHVAAIAQTLQVLADSQTLTPAKARECQALRHRLAQYLG